MKRMEVHMLPLGCLEISTIYACPSAKNAVLTGAHRHVAKGARLRFATGPQNEFRRLKEVKEMSR
jgi:hypothetical protein